MNERVATRTLDRCLACGGTRLKPLAMRYVWEGRTFPGASCGACGMRFLRVQPIGETLERMYAKAYFAEDFRCGRSDVDSADGSTFRAESDGLLDRFERLVPPSVAPRRLLEVGCAYGWLLQRATERGWQSRGVEFSADAVRHARGLGLDVFQGGLEQAELPSSAFDLVYMGDVLEHVPDCGATVREVARVLAPGGAFVVRGPLTTNSLARRLGLAAWGLAGRAIELREPPYHLWEFTPGPLKGLLARSGLTVERIDESKIPPGSAKGRKRGPARALMAALDLANVPITKWFNAFGDRGLLVARRDARVSR